MSVRLDIWYPGHPGDDAGLRAALKRLPLDRVRQLAVLGKTEGPATLNDFSRDLAIMATDTAIEEVGGADLLARSWRLFSTGCEGLATPITFLFADIDERASKASGPLGLVFGAARSAPLPPEERCGPAHIMAAAATVQAATDRAGLSNDQVTLALIKSPVRPAGTAGSDPALRRHGGSTGSARGAAALGAAVALGEIDAAALGPDPVGYALQLYTRRAMTFSGTETDRIEAVVFGERPGGSALRMAGAVLTDLLDGAALREPLAKLGTAAPRLVFFKAGIAADGRLRGRRTTVLGSDLPPDKQLRAAASGLIGAWFSNTDAFISGGAEHQGPQGACLCMIIGTGSHQT